MTKGKRGKGETKRLAPATNEISNNSKTQRQKAGKHRVKRG